MPNNARPIPWGIHADDFAALGAKGHAYTDFMGALCDRICNDAVGPDQRHQQRDSR
jgi:hypothetical protein